MECPLWAIAAVTSSRQISGRALPVISFVHFPVECPFNKFYGIDCRSKLGAKLLDPVFHRRRQVSPPIDNLTHRFLDGSQHLLYCNVTVGSRHGAVPLLPADKLSLSSMSRTKLGKYPSAMVRRPEDAPIREAAFASLKARPRPVPVPVDPMDGSEEREVSGRRRILQCDSRKTNARPARSSELSGDP
jgi:hypothetical protein